MRDVLHALHLLVTKTMNLFTHFFISFLKSRLTLPELGNLY
jgi:hypothetical protein